MLVGGHWEVFRCFFLGLGDLPDVLDWCKEFRISGSAEMGRLRGLGRGVWGSGT